MRIDELHAGVAKRGPLKGNKTIFGKCRRCGKEVRESIQVRSELVQIAQRSERYYERAQRKRTRRSEELEKLTMAKKRRKDKKASKDEETTTTKKRAKSSKKSSKTATRERHWDRPEGAPNGTQTMMIIMAGGPHTLEELQERHDRLAKSKKISRRLDPLTTIDFTWKNLDEVVIDDVTHVRYVGFDDDGDFVFSVPTIKDPLKKNAKVLKLRKRGGKLFIGDIRVATSRKALKA